MVSIFENTNLFRIEKLSTKTNLDNFTCSIPEYSDFLKSHASDYFDSYIATTFVLIEDSTGVVCAYISLIADAVTLTRKEKKQTGLQDIPFNTLPALKIAKLAVDKNIKNKFCGIGSFLIAFARTIARETSQEYIACRILTVDADVENDPQVTQFYEKNGFSRMGDKIYTIKFAKRIKIVGMWADIF